jgi:phage terminase large subunit-like protein
VAEDGPHVLRVVPADGRTTLGTSPTLCVADERAHWLKDRGDELENALLSGIGKRNGRYIMISTSAPNDAHPFSKWLDEPPAGAYMQEHRADDGCPPDDIDQIRKANPGAEYGIGASIEWLQAQARRAIARGGAALTSYRLYNLNQRVSDENRDVLLTVDQWLACEVSELPPRQGQVFVGIDLGGSASMTAAAYFWPETGRLEAHGWFPTKPGLSDRGAADGVGQRYCEMSSRAELSTLGAQTVPVAAWLSAALRRVEGERIAALVADRYKRAEIGEAIDAAGIRCPIVWRGFGFKDGNEDVQRFQRAVFDGLVKAEPSLLLRSAFADCVCVRDISDNIKLARARSLGRIDAASASVLAVAAGARTFAPVRKAREPMWV